MAIRIISLGMCPLLERSAATRKRRECPTSDRSGLIARETSRKTRLVSKVCEVLSRKT
jgi:hypothetical protein